MITSSGIFLTLHFSYFFIHCSISGFITGTHTPERCPVGTYSNSTSLTNSTECDLCEAGYACETTGLTEPDTDCVEGYYCPEGKL